MQKPSRSSLPPKKRKNLDSEFAEAAIKKFQTKNPGTSKRLTRSGNTPKKIRSAVGSEDQLKSKTTVVLHNVDIQKHFFCVVKSCEEGFATFAELSSHMKEHDCNFFQCSQCCEMFLDSNVFDIHRLGHKDDGVDAFDEEEHEEDDDDDDDQPKQSELITPLSIEVAEGVMATCSYLKPKVWSCNLCDRTISRRDDYPRHLRSCKKSPGRNFKCKYCYENLAGKSAFIHHLQTDHKVSGDILCENCSQLFKSDNTYRKHKCSKSKK